jgi:hypothetical protein
VIYVGTSISKGEMHITYTDPNKMLFFHVVTVHCDTLSTSFDKLLYCSRKKIFFLLLSKPEMRRLLHLVVAVKSSSSQCFLKRAKHRMERGLDSKGDDLSSQILVSIWW